MLSAPGLVAGSHHPVSAASNQSESGPGSTPAREERGMHNAGKISQLASIFYEVRCRIGGAKQGDHLADHPYGRSPELSAL